MLLTIVRETVDTDLFHGATLSACRSHLLNLSISVSRGKETTRESGISGERNRGGCPVGASFGVTDGAYPLGRLYEYVSLELETEVFVDAKKGRSFTQTDSGQVP